LPAVPCQGHVAEFFPHLFLRPEAMRHYGLGRFPGRTIYSYERRRPFLELLRGVASGSRPLRELLEVRGLEEEVEGVISLMEALRLDRRTLYPGINVPNLGVISNLPPWATVEAPAYVDASGIHPLSLGSMPTALTGVMAQRLAQYEVTIDAALTGDRELALQALLIDGYLRSIDAAEEMLDDFLDAERRWLPEYWFS
ncbi:MAG: glycoside hydrolase family protein, partial [Candidatus Bathyarchaeota archaeon B23]